MALKLTRPERPSRKKKLSAAEQGQRANKMILRRTLILMIVCGIAAFIPLIATLYNLMIRDHDKYEELAINNQTRSTNLTASRGLIYDRNMNILASSTTVETVFIDPNEIAKKMEKPENSGLLDKIANGLSEILDVKPEFVKEQASDTTYMYKIIKRKISEDLADKVRTFITDNDISGVYLEADAKRYYPYTSLAAQVLGFVSTDNVGSEGLESYYDSYLEGTAGKVVTTKGNYGSEMLYTYEKCYDASDGDSLVTTLDTTVQYYLEKNLEAAISKYDVLHGALGIVMDVNTGDVLAMANIGSYDPNNYLEIYDDQTAAELEKQYQDAESLNQNSTQYKDAIAAYNTAVATARLRQWRNRCVSDGYEPGSTFKLITLASALDSGRVTLNDTFYCGGKADFTGRDQTLSCWKASGHGMQTTEQALGNSCNIAFANIGLKLGGEEFYDYVKAFGLMEPTGIDLPGEASGYFFSKDQLTGASTASLISGAFGQTFKITPLQLVRAVSAIVNGGYLLQPHIVSEVLSSDGNVVQKNERTVLRQVISSETSSTMRELMEYVVTTGTAQQAKVPGYRIGGKTGTSEKIDEYDENGVQVNDKIVSFIGVAPINDPKYVVLVALDTPDYVPGTSYTPTGYYISGGLMAAPTVRDVFSDILPYLGVDPDYSDSDIKAINVAVPNVVGMTEAEAKKALSEKGLTYHTEGDGDKVTDQTPVGNAEVPGASEIILYMGAEKPTDKVTVPDFTGCSVADANYYAANAGLYLQAKGTDQTQNYVTVTYQDIAAGTEVDRGTTITVEFTDHSALD
jgi:stage V sporulation protein D (sporulation-specific penicillin-binding protein)